MWQRNISINKNNTQMIIIVFIIIIILIITFLFICTRIQFTFKFYVLTDYHQYYNKLLV